MRKALYDQVGVRYVRAEWHRYGPSMVQALTSRAVAARGDQAMAVACQAELSGCGNGFSACGVLTARPVCPGWREAT